MTSRCVVGLVGVAAIALGAAWMVLRGTPGKVSGRESEGARTRAPSARSASKGVRAVEPRGAKRSAGAARAERLPVGAPVRPVGPDDVAAFNAAVDAGEAVADAARKAFPEGTGTDGILAALKLMAASADPRTRRGVYRAVSRLFTDEMDLAAAVARTQSLLDSLPTRADDGSQTLDAGGEEESAAEDVGAVATEKGSAAAAEADVADDSEAAPADRDSGEGAIALSDEVEPLLDGVQGDEVEGLLKAGVADADADVRREALEAASQMEDHFQYGAYEEVLKGGDSALKKSVLELCSQFGREEDVAVQRQALKDADPEVAAQARANLESDAAKAFLAADAAAKAAESADQAK